jgi:hypothetical protein
MLRAIAAFFVLFWLVGLSVHLAGVVHVFIMTAAAMLAYDLILRPRIRKPSRSSGMWPDTTL